MAIKFKLPEGIASVWTVYSAAYDEGKVIVALIVSRRGGVDVPCRGLAWCAEGGDAAKARTLSWSRADKASSLGKDTCSFEGDGLSRFLEHFAAQKTPIGKFMGQWSVQLTDSEVAKLELALLDPTRRREVPGKPGGDMEQMKRQLAVAQAIADGKVKSPAADAAPAPAAPEKPVSAPVVDKAEVPPSCDWMSWSASLGGTSDYLMDLMVCLEAAHKASVTADKAEQQPADSFQVSLGGGESIALSKDMVLGSLKAERMRKLIGLQHAANRFANALREVVGHSPEAKI